MMVSTDPMHQFQIERLVPIEINGWDLSFTNSALWMVLSVLGVIVFLALVTANLKTVPGRAQSLAEIWYGFVNGIVKDVNHEDGKPFVPLVFTIFSFIFVANMLGMIGFGPFHVFTTTSHVAVTGALALFTVGLVVVVGVWKNGFKFLKVFVPSGVPIYVLWFVVIIEIFSFLSRPLSLAMRLFANMLAGHVALKIFAGFIPTLAISLGALGVAMGGLLVLPLVIGITALEFLVAFLQAYVFAILTCVYLNDALHPGH
ncbi:MAG: F0F1 ATP synthase subunit A [Hyphomonadaceae bacterium]